MVAAATLALVAPATTAWADNGGRGGHGGHGGPDNQVTEVATGLSGPRQIDRFRGDKLVVAESDTGEISSVNPRNGRVETLFSVGAPGAVNPQGVATDDGNFYVALGEVGGGPENPQPIVPPAPFTNCVPASQAPAASALVVYDRRGRAQFVCDLLAAEFALNPDDQPQLDDNDVPFDSLSNPFAVLVQDRRVLVADAGANTVWSIDRRNGRISEFFVPPLVTDVQGCENANPGIVGCDPVPTGVVQGPDGKLYVSTLGGLTPGAGRVYVLDQRGRVVRTITGLNPMTGIAVDHRGTVYVSDLLAGQVVRIDRRDNRSYVAVPAPFGLEFIDGSLYVAANGFAFGPPPVVGQVLRIGQDAFGPDQQPLPPAGPPAE